MKRALRLSIEVTESGHREVSADAKIFEAGLMKAVGEKIDKHFYAKVAGVTYANEDGTKRQDLIECCREYELIDLQREHNNPIDSNAVRVANSSGQVLGYLHREVAAQVASDFDVHGRVWLAAVRKVTAHDGAVPAGLVICLFRLSEEYVAAHSPIAT